MIAHTPLSVAATSTAPSEAWPMAKRIAAPFAAAPDRARRHAEPRRRGLVEAARRVEAGVVDRLGDRLRRAQAIGRAARPHLRGIGLRRHAGDLLEHAMEMERAQARARGEGAERGRLFRRRDLLARALDRLDLRIGRRRACRACSACRRGSPPAPLPPRSKRTTRSRASPAARRSSGGNRRRSCGPRTETCRRRPGRGGATACQRSSSRAGVLGT